MSPQNPQDPQKGKPFEDVQAGQDAQDAAALKAEVEATEHDQPEPSTSEGGTPSAEGAAAAETGIDKAAADALAGAGDGADEEPLAAPADDDAAAVVAEADDAAAVAADDEIVADAGTV